MDRRSPVAAAAGGAVLSVRLTPKAGSNRIGPVAVDGPGAPVLKVQVTAVPEGGKANRALIALLAKSWRLPKSALTIRSGAKDRMKTLFVTAPAEDLRTKLESGS